MAKHDPDWRQDDKVLTGKQKLLNYTGYYCTICYQTLAVPPGGMPSLAPH